MGDFSYNLKNCYMKDLTLEQTNEIVDIINKIIPGLFKNLDINLTEEIEADILTESYVRCARNPFTIKDDGTVFKSAVIIITKRVLFENAKKYKSYDVKNTIDIGKSEYYEFNRPEFKERTNNRLIQIGEMGMKDLGNAQFGIKGIMSGLYIEMVWSKADVDWIEYVEWAQELIENKTEK